MKTFTLCAITVMTLISSKSMASCYAFSGGIGPRQIDVFKLAEQPQKICISKFEKTNDENLVKITMSSAAGNLLIASAVVTSNSSAMELNLKSGWLFRAPVEYKRMQQIDLTGSSIVINNTPFRTNDGRILYIDRLPFAVEQNGD